MYSHLTYSRVEWSMSSAGTEEYKPVGQARITRLVELYFKKLWWNNSLV